MPLIKKLAAKISALIRRKGLVESELRESQLRFQQLTEHIREGFYIADPEISRIFYVSPAYAKTWGLSRESLYANPRLFLEAIHVDDRERAMQAIAPHGKTIPHDIEYRVVRPDGTVRWVRDRCFVIRNESGEIYRVTGIAEDITERKNAMDQITRQAEALEQSNRRLSLLGEMTSLLQSVVSVEEAAAILSGYMAQLHIGDGGAVYLFKESRNLLDLLARWGEEKLAGSVLPDQCWALRRGQPYQPSKGTQLALRCKHVQQVDGPSAYLCLPMMAESGALGLLHVVFSEESPATWEDEALFAQRMCQQLGLALANLRLREKLRLEAIQDPLTGLFNRRFLEISLKREFSRAERENNSVAISMLDVDHFKRFNDTHGHDAGDAVLRHLGQVLEENCRAVDLACRFGGEEFTVVFPGATREAMAVWAERLLARVRHMKVVADGLVLPQVTVSVGIAFFPEHGKETEEVLQAADQALYAAKKAGRDRYLFSPEKPRSTGSGQETRGRTE